MVFLRIVCLAVVATSVWCYADHTTEVPSCPGDEPCNWPCTECRQGFFEVFPCTDTRETKCQRCSPCGDGFFIEEPCGWNTNTVCGRCMTCKGNTFASQICGENTNTVCSVCTECAPGETEVQPCSAWRDRICAVVEDWPEEQHCYDGYYWDLDWEECLECTICDPETETEAKECNSWSNTICKVADDPNPKREETIQEDTTSLSTGAIVGIVLGVVLVLIVVLALLTRKPRDDSPRHDYESSFGGFAATPMSGRAFPQKTVNSFASSVSQPLYDNVKAQSKFENFLI